MRQTLDKGNLSDHVNPKLLQKLQPSVHDIFVNKEYITSEQFIWDDLLARAKFANKQVQQTWKKRRKIPVMVLAWPAVTIHDDNDKPINSIVSLEVPEGIPLQKALKDLIVRTKAYAILVCDSTNEELRVVLESHHGVRSWITSIRHHGDVRVLEDTRVQDGVGGFGLLWRKERGLG
jgi:hypothetical protein